MATTTSRSTWYTRYTWCTWCLYTFFLVFTTTLGSSISPPLQSSTITYQVHSYNDLREWPQILRKGAVYFKVDPHFMPSSFCTTQPQWQGDSDDGCFVLSHDFPVPQRQYNTTYSILNFIADPQYAAYYKNVNQAIHIALCFKLDFASPCDGSPTAQNWTAITQQFFDTANAVVASKGLNVVFILDGSSTPTDSNLCLINKWRPWVATWSPGNSAAAPYSNNATLGLDRFQVFNPPAVTDVPAYYIDLWSVQDYGKFSQSNYSYLIWEPSDQQPILDISSSYLRGPLHELGLRFAINIDPVQLQVFTGTKSGTAWNNAIASPSSSFSSSPSPSPSFSQPTLAVVSDPTSNEFFIISTFTEEQTNVSYYTVTTAPSWTNNQLGPVASTATKELSISGGGGGGGGGPINSISTIGPGSTIFASQANGSYSLFSFNESVQELSSLGTGRLLPCVDCKTITVTVGASDVYGIQITNGNPGCSLQLQVWQLQNITKPTKLGVPNCVQNNTTIRYYDVAFSGSQQGESYCSTGALPGILAFSDPSNNIYTSVLCLNTSTGVIEVNGGEGMGVAVDVGSETSVSLYTFNGQLVVLEVHADGFCWNDEPNNKQPTPATCSNTPISIQYILNYNFGSFDSWATHVMNVLNHKNRSFNLDSFFSSCHPTILHGAYDSGSDPQVTLFSASYNSQEVLLHAEVHVGIPKSFNSTSQCGYAVPMEGAVVLDSWLLSSWTVT